MKGRRGATHTPFAIYCTNGVTHNEPHTFGCGALVVYTDTLTASPQSGVWRTSLLTPMLGGEAIWSCSTKEGDVSMKWNQETRALQCGREDVVSNGWAMPIFAYMFILAFFVAMIMGSPTVVQAETTGDMVCKNGPRMYFKAIVHSRHSNKNYRDKLVLYFKKAARRADRAGKKLNPGECGLIGKRIPSGLAGETYIDTHFTFEIEKGSVKILPSEVPWVDLKRKKRKVISFPVTITHDRIIFERISFFDGDLKKYLR